MTTPKVYVIIYSLYGHIATMAKEIKEGLKESSCEVIICRAPELLSDETLTKMHAPPSDTSIPICKVADLVSADGIVFGICTRFGMANAQLKSLWDATGQLWQSGGLVGKPASIFVCTGTQGGGQETTALTWITQLAHHGMIFVPNGYVNHQLFNMDEIHGGSAYGAGTFAGIDGSRQPSPLEKEIARFQGKYFGSIVTTLKEGRAVTPEIEHIPASVPDAPELGPTESEEKEIEQLPPPDIEIEIKVNVEDAEKQLNDEDKLAGDEKLTEDEKPAEDEKPTDKKQTAEQEPAEEIEAEIKGVVDEPTEIEETAQGKLPKVNFAGVSCTCALS